MNKLVYALATVSALALLPVANSYAQDTTLGDVVSAPFRITGNVVTGVGNVVGGAVEGTAHLVTGVVVGTGRVVGDVFVAPGDILTDTGAVVSNVVTDSAGIVTGVVVGTGQVVTGVVTDTGEVVFNEPIAGPTEVVAPAEEEVAPAPAAESEAAIQLLTRERVYFGVDDAQLSAESLNRLENLYHFIQDNPDSYQIAVGYASTTASQEHNFALSKQRVENVVNWLVERGADPSRIQAYYSGENDLPVPTPDNVEEGANRTVVISVARVAQ